MKVFEAELKDRCEGRHSSTTVTASPLRDNHNKQLFGSDKEGEPARYPSDMPNRAIVKMYCGVERDEVEQREPGR